MNKQGRVVNNRVVGGIEWTKTIWPDGTETQGYTSNPMKGCLHGCKWVMPDGTIANCYAEDVADRLAQRAYPQGFEHYYWEPQEMEGWKSLRSGTKVFVGSMADVFGSWVPTEHIAEMFKNIRELPGVTFQLLTKNPRRALDFTIPKNAWLGASTPPNVMNRNFRTGIDMSENELSERQREALFMNTLMVFETLKSREVMTWISAEPLTLDAAKYLNEYPVTDWVVIGAASNGRDYYKPDEQWVKNLVEYGQRHKVPVFFKGNLKVLPWAAENWKEEFPEGRREQ